MASKKEKLLADLEGFNVELTGEESVTELTELLAKAKEDAGGDDEAAEETDEEADTEEEDEEESGKVDGATEVTVGYIHPQEGQTTRTFSKAVHGKDFKKTAKQFVETHKDKSATILK